MRRRCAALGADVELRAGRLVFTGHASRERIERTGRR
jgi:hypothetical protein